MYSTNADAVIGFTQVLYEVSENASLAMVAVIVAIGSLQREVVVQVSSQDDTALGMCIEVFCSLNFEPMQH